MRYTFLLLAGMVTMTLACNNPKKSSSANGNDLEKLNGSWVLNYITGPRIAFEGLYPDRKPEINFSTADMHVSGNTGCNSFSGQFKVDGNKLSFNEAMAMTKMFCPGTGETVFTETLRKINAYAISGDTTLNLLMGDIGMMRFSRK